MQSTATLPVNGMDIAKNVFQLHIVDAETGEVKLHKIRRDRVTIGLLPATALVSTATDLSSFDSGSQFAAWLGLTPRQTGTDWKTRQLGISKRGDPYVGTMLKHGARAVIARSQRSGWIERLLLRRPYSVVVAELANKLDRTAWAVLVQGKALDQVRWNPDYLAAV